MRLKCDGVIWGEAFDGIDKGERDEERRGRQEGGDKDKKGRDEEKKEESREEVNRGGRKCK